MRENVWYKGIRHNAAFLKRCVLLNYPCHRSKHLRPDDLFHQGFSFIIASKGEKMNTQTQKNTKKSKKIDVKRLTLIAMLSAIGVVLQYMEFSIPVMPGFIKLDFSDLPELIGAFVLGPGAGVLICFIRNVIHIIVSQSGAIGELSNFILGAFFALTAGFIHKKMPGIKGAVTGAVTAALVMGLVSLPSNYFLIYPLYYNVMGFPEPAILQMYQLIRPSTSSIAEALLVFNVPFTAAKGLICGVLAIAVYKPLRKFIQK